MTKRKEQSLFRECRFWEILKSLWQDLCYFSSQIHLRGSSVPYHFRPRLKNSKYDTATGSVFSVLSYNVDFSSVYFPHKANAIISAIAEASADFVCLQETNEKWEHYLLSSSTIIDACGYRYSTFHHDDVWPAGGCAILSRYLIQEIKILNARQTVDGSVFPTMLATLSLGNDETTSLLRIANVHLRPPLELKGGHATLSTPRTTRAVREKELSYILSSCNRLSFLPDLIIGDFNEQDYFLNQMFLPFHHQKWRNALSEFVSTKKETHIWPFLNFLILKKRLDHIFYQSDALTCNYCGVISGFESGASDHQPVMAEFHSI